MERVGNSDRVDAEEKPEMGPIRVCVEGVYEDLHTWRSKTEYVHNDPERIGYASHPSGRAMSHEQHSFFSPVSENDKESREHFNCIGIVVVGFDTELQKNISFIVHARPDKILESLSQRRFFKKKI